MEVSLAKFSCPTIELDFSRQMHMQQPQAMHLNTASLLTAWLHHMLNITAVLSGGFSWFFFNHGAVAT